MRKILLALSLLIPLALYQNCSEQVFTKEEQSEGLGAPSPIDCIDDPNPGSITCGDGGSSFQLYFTNDIGTSLGKPTSGENGEIFIQNVRGNGNGRSASINLFLLGDGSIQILMSENNHPWICHDHSQGINEEVDAFDRDGNPIVADNCVSPIVWFTSRGEKGAARVSLNGAETRLNAFGDGGNFPQTPFDRSGQSFVWVEIRRADGQRIGRNMASFPENVLPHYRNLSVNSVNRSEYIIVELAEQDFLNIPGSQQTGEFSLDSLYPGEGLVMQRVNLQNLAIELRDELRTKYQFLPWPDDIP